MTGSIAFSSRRLRTARRDQGVTRHELGAYVNLSGSAIGMYERGQRRPSADTVAALAHALGVRVTYLFEPVGERS